MGCHSVQYGLYRFIPVITGAAYPSLHATVVLIQDSTKIILIDTGYFTDRELLIDRLKEIDVAPEAITHLVLTHFHIDHTGNAEIFRRAKVFLGSEDFETVREIYKNINNERKLEAIIENITNIRDNKKIRALKTQMKNNYSILEYCVRNERKISLIEDNYQLDEKIFLKKTPGHSKGHISVWSDFGRGNRICVSGDALPMAALIDDHIKPAEAGLIIQNTADFLASKKEILTWADIIYPGHDQPTFLRKNINRRRERS